MLNPASTRRLSTVMRAIADNEVDAREAIEDVLKDLELATSPHSRAPRFPAELRKMWSGTEVQAWLDEHCLTSTLTGIIRLPAGWSLMVDAEKLGSERMTVRNDAMEQAVVVYRDATHLASRMLFSLAEAILRDHAEAQRLVDEAGAGRAARRAAVEAAWKEMEACWGGSDEYDAARRKLFDFLLTPAELFVREVVDQDLVLRLQNEVDRAASPDSPAVITHEDAQTILLALRPLAGASVPPRSEPLQVTLPTGIDAGEFMKEWAEVMARPPHTILLAVHEQEVHADMRAAGFESVADLLRAHLTLVNRVQAITGAAERVAENLGELASTITFDTTLASQARVHTSGYLQVIEKHVPDGKERT